MTFRPVLLLCLLVSAVLTAPSFAAGDRVALVIGNAKYPDADTPLKQPVNDAHEIADELKRDGFSVDIQENATGDAMRRAFDRLYGKIKPGSVALVFYSGFGIQSNRQSYMIPVDAQIWQEADVRRDGVSLEAVLGEINSRGAGVKIALIDASRRNPFERRFRTSSAGLAPVIAPNGTLVMYSAAPASVISDDGSDHGLFVKELLKEIRVAGLAAEETLNRTRVGVTRASHSEQVPWISSSLAEDFSFVPGSGGRPAAPAEADVVPQATGPSPAQVAAAPSAPQPASPPAPSASPADSPRNPPAANAAPSPQVAPADDPAIKALNDKLGANPADAASLHRRGQLYAGKGAYALALKDFDAVIRIKPKDVEALNNRCWVRTVIGDLHAALKDCNEALRLQPNYADALDSRGLLNLKNGATKNALADFDAALKLNPRLVSSLYGRGLARQRSGAAQEGAQDIADAEAMDPNIAREYETFGVR